MLVLTRREQSIVIGTDIVVTVLEVKGDQIRLGISAPRRPGESRREILRRGRKICRPDGCLVLGGAETTLGVDDK